jgi:hypothetical protein
MVNGGEETLSPSESYSGDREERSQRRNSLLEVLGIHYCDEPRDEPASKSIVQGCQRAKKRTKLVQFQ